MNGVFAYLRERTDRHLTSAAQASHDGPLGHQCRRRRWIVDARDQLLHATIATADLDGDDALTWRRHTGLDRQNGGDP